MNQPIIFLINRLVHHDFIKKSKSDILKLLYKMLLKEQTKTEDIQFILLTIEKLVVLNGSLVAKF